MVRAVSITIIAAVGVALAPIALAPLVLHLILIAHAFVDQHVNTTRGGRRRQLVVKDPRKVDSHKLGAMAVRSDWRRAAAASQRP